MSYNKSEKINAEEDSRSFEENGNYSFCNSFSRRDKEDLTNISGSLSQQHQTWSPFEDLDDSGHFTASPDGERALSGSSRSHSPCPSSAHILLQMQNLNLDSSSQSHTSPSNPNPYQHQWQRPGSPLHHSQQQQSSSSTQKPLISPRSVMTVKVPQTQSSINYSSMTPFDSTCTVPSKTLHDVSSSGSLESFLSRPLTYTVDSSKESLASISNFSSVTSIVSGAGGSNNKDAGDAVKHEGQLKDESCEYLRSILVNFNSLYMEKLKMIDDLVAEGSEEQRKLLVN